MTLVGFTALSVEINTNESAPDSMASSASRRRGGDYIFYRFTGVILHQGDMLVGRRVEYHLWPVSVHNVADSGVIEDVGDDQIDLHAFHVAASGYVPGRIVRFPSDPPPRSAAVKIAAIAGRFPSLCCRRCRLPKPHVRRPIAGCRRYPILPVCVAGDPRSIRAAAARSGCRRSTAGNWGARGLRSGYAGPGR